MNLHPKISIITVVRNGEEHIEGTIKSILSQTYNDIEYIIIDGKSTDKTVEIIQRYEANVSYWISEPDRGIYDAMNKGVKNATGEWILFINADDFLASSQVIEQAAKYLAESDKQLVYGRVVFLFASGKTKLYGDSWETSKSRFRNVAMCIPHQATFHHRTLFNNNEHFDPSFRIAGDYDFLLRHLKNHEASFIPVTVTQMRADGISFSAGKILLLKETRKAQLKNRMYRFFPSFDWILSATKLLIVNTIIRTLGETGKDKIKNALNPGKTNSQQISR